MKRNAVPRGRDSQAVILRTFYHPPCQENPFSDQPYDGSRLARFVRPDNLKRERTAGFLFFSEQENENVINRQERKCYFSEGIEKILRACL